ncbi:hypothetical protein TDB9533_00893 [Thalassocella blandensis]|nr:hypothetical protein TDB9533_00893 [Thalassocella blandensis]
MTSHHSPCIFCDIVNNNAKSFTVFATDQYSLVLDIYPITFGHMLLISHTHASHIHQLPEQEFSAMIEATKKITEKLPASLPDISDCNIIINNGSTANQHIPHAHIHIIPRRKGDTLRFYWRLLTRFVLPFSRLNSTQKLENAHQALEAILLK